MKFLRANNRLSPKEKKEMLEDAKDPRRREDFRKVRGLLQKMRPEEYIRWMTKVSTLIPERNFKKSAPESL